MGNELRKDQGALTFVPPIVSPNSGRKYQPITLLGSGAFGFVIKVQDVETKLFYAIKCARRESKKYGEVNDTCEQEKNILKHLGSHSNIVSLIEFFTLDHTPIPVENLKEKGTFDLIVLEFCEGCDLSQFLVSKQEIPFTYAIQWFIVILQTIAYIHKNDVVHRDMKPDNILVVFKGESKSLDDIILKVSDFGSAKIAHAKEKIGGRRGCHMFYSSPELVFAGKGTNQVDIWSLGLVFFQCISRISVNEFEKLVRNMFKILMISPKSKKYLLKKFKLKTIKDISYLQLMHYTQKKNLIWKNIVSLMIDDESVKNVLKKMICSKRRRKTAVQLLKDPVVQSWEIITKEKRKIYFCVHHEALLSFLRKKEKLNVCFEVLFAYNDYVPFVDAGGLEILFNMMKPSDSLRFSKIFSRMMILNESTIRYFTILFRKSDVLKIYERTLLTFDDRFSYLFIFLIFSNCPTIAKNFMPLMEKLIAKANPFNVSYILAIIEILIPHTPAKKLVNFFQYYKESEVLFLKKINFAELDKLDAQEINAFLMELFSRINKNFSIENEIEEYLILILTYLNNYYLNNSLVVEKTQTVGIKHTLKPTRDCRLNYFWAPNSQFNVKMSHENFLTKFHCDSNDKNNNEILSSEAIGFVTIIDDSPIEEELLEEIPVAVHEKNESGDVDELMVEEELLEEVAIPILTDSSAPIWGAGGEFLGDDDDDVEEDEEKIELIDEFPVPDVEDRKLEESEKKVVVAYFELNILDGGYSDDCSLGFYMLENGAESQIIYDCHTGNLSYYELKNEKVGEEEERRDKLLYEQEIGNYYCFSNAVIGCGATKNGYFFLTYNNQLIKPFVKIPMKMSRKLYALMRINGNGGFSGTMNFGLRRWNFNFVNNKRAKRPPKKSQEEIRQHEIKYDVKVMKELISPQSIRTLQAKYKNVPDIAELCKIISHQYKLQRQKKKKKVLTRDERILNNRLIDLYGRESRFQRNLTDTIGKIKLDFSKMKKLLENMEETYSMRLVNKHKSDMLSTADKLRANVKMAKKKKKRSFLKGLFGGSTFGDD